MTVQTVNTLHSDGVDRYAYTLLLTMLGPEGDQVYTLSFRFSERMDRWVLSIADAAGRAVVTGAPVLQTVNLLSYAAPGLRPRGYLVCIWKTPSDDAPEPGERDLGAWAEIIYFERVEDLDLLEPIEAPVA